MGDLNLFSFLIFIAGGFAASLITALAGFAFGIIAAGPWLHVLTPSQTTALIVAYGLVVQGYSVWKLRAAIKIGRLLPFLLGGATGLAGIVVMIWSGLRGWSKDEQRAVFQPAGVANFAMIALWIGGVGVLDRDTMMLCAVGLPFILAGLWIGFAFYRKTDEAGFRKIVLILLLVSGATLLV